MKKATAVMITLLVWVSSGLAQGSRTAQYTIELAPTVVGQAVNLNAQATKATYVRPKRTIEVLSVLVWSDMQATSEDGEENEGEGEAGEDPVVLQVLIDTTSGQTNIPVGAITLSEGSGNLILMSHIAFWSDQPGNLPVPLSEIKRVKLVHHNDYLAEGSF